MTTARTDPALREWATFRQREFMDAIEKHGSATAAEVALGVSQGLIARSMRRLKAFAASKGWSPAHDMTRAVPDPFVVKGVSTYYNKDGVAAGQWVKSRLVDSRLTEALQAASEAMTAELPRVLPLERPDATDSNLCNLYTITDAHVGMMAWHKEGGADWDLKIAEQTLTRCFERMVMQAPPARVAVVSQQGDFLHYDSLSPVTPTHGHVLDADGRFSKMVAVAILVLRRMVDMALMRHDAVHVVIAEGNHDLTSSVWLRQMFAALYENEPRVTVDQTELPYYVFQHGETMLGVHHGHMRKNDQLPLLFASQFPKIWGETTRRYIHTGHRHHVEEKEHAGVTVIQHPTLAARDAYAARGGWIALRQAHAITYHDQFGQVGRVTVTPEMVV